MSDSNNPPPNSPATIDIDEILDDIWFNYELEVSTIENKLKRGVYIPQEAEARIREQQEEAKAQITALITEKENRARVDELENLKQYYPYSFDYVLKRIHSRITEIATRKSKGRDK